MLKQVSILATVFLCLFQSVSFAKSTNSYWLDGKWPHEKSTLPKHDEAYYGRLDNGFRYIIQPNSNPKDRVSVQLLVQVGSLMENDQERGIAHFLEHLAYNGSKNFPAGKLIPFFQSNGMTFGKDVNAYTSLRETVYKLNLLNKTSSIKDGLVFMRDVADGILIDTKEVEAERGVIISEKNARDSEQYRVRKRLRHFFYKDTEFQYDTIGEEQIIKTVSPKTIKAFYDAWYRPENMILMVVGSIDPQEIKKLIQEKFADLQARAAKREVFPFKDKVLKGIHTYYDKYESEATTVQIKAQGSLRWSNDSLQVQQEMLNAAMANNIISTRLRTMISEGKAPFLKAAANFSDAFGFFPTANIFATTEADSWQLSLEQLQNTLLVALKYGFLEEEVQDVKKIFLRSFERKMNLASQEENDTIIKSMIGCFMADRVYQSWPQTFSMVKDMIEKTTAKTLLTTLRSIWEVDNRIVSVVGNADIKDATTTLAQLWDTGLKKELQPVQAAKSAPYPYVAMPKGGSTVKTQNAVAIPNTELTYHEVTFKNGLVLRMIPTPFSEGKTSLQLALGSGTDAITDADFVQAKVAQATDSQSGFGNLNMNDVRRLMGAEGISVKTQLTQEYLALSSDFESKNLAKNLEALWTQYKDPSINAQDRNLTLRNFGIADAKRGKDLNSAMQLAGLQLFWKESLRNAPITQDMATKFTLETLQKTLQKLYANAGAPVLNMVGDMDVNAAIKLVGKSFGADEVSWPHLEKAPYEIDYAFASAGKKEEHIEVVSPVNQAAIRLGFYRPLDDVLDRKTLLTRRLVSSLLGDVMRKAIREKFGASYSPRVMYWASDNNGYGMYLVNITTQHENFEQMRTEVSKLVTQFAAKGVDAKTLMRMKKPMLGSWMQSAKQNKVYTSLLSLMVRKDRPYLQWHGDFVSMVKSISLEEINAEITQAFGTNNKAMLTGVTVEKKQ